MTYFHTKFNMPSSNGSLAISVKPKAKCAFLTTTTISKKVAFLRRHIMTENLRAL
jgi:hypothetical protein